MSTLGPDDMKLRLSPVRAAGRVCHHLAHVLRRPKAMPMRCNARWRAAAQNANETQPTKDRSAGSTFSQSGRISSTGQADERPSDLKKGVEGH